MTRQEYITALHNSLYRLSKADRDDILSDYEAHFTRGLEEGKSEEEICAQLGDPVELAAIYLENVPQQAAQPTYQQPTYQQPAYQQPVYQQAPVQANAQPNAEKAKRFNTENLIIYILMCVFAFVPIAVTIVSILLSLAGMIIGFFAGSIALFVAGAAAMVGSVVGGIGLIFIGVAVMALSGLSVIGLAASIKGVIRLVEWFIGWSRDFVSPVYGS